MSDRASEIRLSRRQVMAGAAAIGGVAAVELLDPVTTVARGPDGPEEYDAAVPTAWFDLALTCVRTTPGFTPPVAARAFGYAGLTLYEAVVPGSREYRSLVRELRGLRDMREMRELRDLRRLPRGRARLHWPAVANASLAAILRALFPTTGPANAAAIDALESSFEGSFRRDLSRSTLRASVERGREVAAAIFGSSRGDGGHEGFLRNFPTTFQPPVGAGLWVPTPPAFQPALQPFWGTNRCLALADASSCSPPAPTGYSERSASSPTCSATPTRSTTTPTTGAASPRADSRRSPRPPKRRRSPGCTAGSTSDPRSASACNKAAASPRPSTTSPSDIDLRPSSLAGGARVDRQRGLLASERLDQVERVVESGPTQCLPGHPLGCCRVGGVGEHRHRGGADLVR